MKWDRIRRYAIRIARKAQVVAFIFLGCLCGLLWFVGIYVAIRQAHNLAMWYGWM